MRVEAPIKVDRKTKRLAKRLDRGRNSSYKSYRYR